MPSDTLPLNHRLRVDYWTTLARENLRGISSFDAGYVAQECVNMERHKSGSASVYHASSRVFGHRCNCANPECVAFRRKGTL